MKYESLAKEKLELLRARDDYYILSIETSCDETAAAVTRGREIISNVISSQIEIHKRFGGVVPEIASRNHTLAIDGVVKEALEKAGLKLGDISLIAVTYGAGLLGALLVGVAYAKALAYALQTPLIAVNHIKGHVFANLLVHKDLNPPFICLLASGGHTEIMKVNSYFDIETIGKTRDDAAGEAFDKVARVLGFSYPGGPQIEKAAVSGQNVIAMPKPFRGEKHFDFSYSGLKTAVINYVHGKKQKGEDINVFDVARSFQEAAVGIMIERAAAVCKKYRIKTLVLAGGVAANGALREGMEKEGAKQGVNVYLPPKILCTDNAAMIGAGAYFAVKGGAEAAKLSLDADANA